jgi:hypothetical protein
MRVTSKWLSVFVLAILTATSCSSLEVAPDHGYLTPLQISARGDELDGKPVFVRGYLYVDSHAICFVDPTFVGVDRVPPEAAFSVLGLELLEQRVNKLKGREIAFRATFRKDVVGSGVLLKGCGRIGVEIQEQQKAFGVR